MEFERKGRQRVQRAADVSVALMMGIRDHQTDILAQENDYGIDLMVAAVIRVGD
jgi:hypothetical protein